MLKIWKGQSSHRSRFLPKDLNFRANKELASLGFFIQRFEFSYKKIWKAQSSLRSRFFYPKIWIFVQKIWKGKSSLRLRIFDPKIWIFVQKIRNGQCSVRLRFFDPKIWIFVLKIWTGQSSLRSRFLPKDLNFRANTELVSLAFFIQRFEFSCKYRARFARVFYPKIWIFVQKIRKGQCSLRLCFLTKDLNFCAKNPKRTGSGTTWPTNVRIYSFRQITKFWWWNGTYYQYSTYSPKNEQNTTEKSESFRKSQMSWVS